MHVCCFMERSLITTQITFSQSAWAPQSVCLATWQWEVEQGFSKTVRKWLSPVRCDELVLCFSVSWSLFCRTFWGLHFLSFLLTVRWEGGWYWLPYLTLCNKANRRISQNNPCGLLTSTNNGIKKRKRQRWKEDSIRLRTERTCNRHRSWNINTGEGCDV